MELGTDDLGSVHGYVLDVCRDGFRNTKAQKKGALATHAKSYQKGSISIRSQKRKAKESVPP